MNLVRMKDDIPVARENDKNKLCLEFCGNSGLKKYILGRNIYTQSVINEIKVDGIIDDYVNEEYFCGIPVLRSSEVPKDALVLSVACGRPLTAQKTLDTMGLRNLDYFYFLKNSGLDLPQIQFNDGFEAEFIENKEQYLWIYGLLNDEESRSSFDKLINFRANYDISELSGFTWKEDVQYFEEILNLKIEGEAFVDVGGFNGYTTLEFIKRAPNYKSIHVFEPEPGNFKKCSESVAGLRNVQLHNIGLSDRKAHLKIDVQGSGSKISEAGLVSIDVDMLDHVLAAEDAPTFIKMDIEGGESAALEGARNTIITHHPRLAISAYHNPGDFWRIPKQVFSMREDYDVYLRHYTESIYESVLFFIPKK